MGFYSNLCVGTLVSTKIFVMNQFLVHIKYMLLANSLQRIKIKIKNKSLLYPIMPFLVTIKYSICVQQPQS